MKILLLLLLPVFAHSQDTIPKPNFVRVDTVQGVFQYVNTNSTLITEPGVRIDSVWKEYINNTEFPKWRLYRSQSGKILSINKWFLFISKSNYQ